MPKAKKQIDDPENLADLPDKADEPGSTDVHVDAPLTNKKKVQSLAYYKHLAGQLKTKATDEEYAGMVKKARAHAGGTTKAQNRAQASEDGESLTAKIGEIDAAFSTQFRSWNGECLMWTQEIFDTYVIARNSRDGEMYRVDFTYSADDEIEFGEPYEVEVQYVAASELADLCAQGKATRLFMEAHFAAEAPDWIPYLPLPGEYKHPRYGEINITPERNANFVDNFKSGKYQEKLPIDAEHETKLSGALGWVTDMRVNENGSVDAKVDWTDRGVSLIEDDRFKYVSPEWYDAWEDPTDGKIYSDVAIGGALTTRPFFKEKALRPLVASEKGLFAFDGALNDLTEGGTSIFFTALPASNEQGAKTMAEDKSAKAGDKATKTFAELQSELDDAKKAVEAKESELTTAKTAAEQAANENRQLSERVQSLETDAQAKRFAELSKGWHGEPVKHSLVLKALGEGSDSFKAYVDQQNAIAEQLRSANLFTEVGSSQTGEANDPLAQLEVKTTEIMATDSKLTREQAFDLALQRNPKLYTEYRNKGVN